MHKSKPRKSPETTIHQLLPFLQLDPETATLVQFFSVGNECLLSALITSPKVFPSSTFKKYLKSHEPEIFHHLKETLTGIRKMIYVATVHHQLPQSELQELLQSFLNPMFSESTLQLTWLGPGQANLTLFSPDPPNPTKWQEPLIIFRKNLIWCTIQVFSSYEGKLRFEALRFTACPTCRNIFEKKRKDQVFCSLSCGNLARVRKKRAKSKTHDTVLTKKA